MKHDIIETERFLKTRKDKEQSVLNFYTKIKKKGLELQMDSALVKQAFCQGLDRETQKHCALKKAGTVEEYLEAALEYEMISQITDEKEETAQTVAIDQQTMMLGPEQARFLKEPLEAYNVNCSWNGQQRQRTNFNNDFINNNHDNRTNFNGKDNQNSNFNYGNNSNRDYNSDRNSKPVVLQGSQTTTAFAGVVMGRNEPRSLRNSNQRNDNKKCYGCGEPHHGLERGSRRAYCSAWGKICNNCGLTNHISKACFNDKSHKYLPVGINTYR